MYKDSKLVIRSEIPTDIEAIVEVTKTAFEDDSFSQQTEHLTINDLRTDNALDIMVASETK